MTAPDEIIYEEYDGKLFVHLDDHKGVVAAKDARIAELEAANARLQAQVDAGPTVAQLWDWSEYCRRRGLNVAHEILETANRMEAANGK